MIDEIHQLQKKVHRLYMEAHEAMERARVAERQLRKLIAVHCEAEVEEDREKNSDD